MLAPHGAEVLRRGSWGAIGVLLGSIWGSFWYKFGKDFFPKQSLAVGVLADLVGGRCWPPTAGAEGSSSKLL